MQRWQQAAGVEAGPLFRAVRRGGHVTDAPSSVAELQQAGGWKSPTTPAVYIRHEEAARGPVARRRYKVGK